MSKEMFAKIVIVEETFDGYALANLGNADNKNYYVVADKAEVEDLVLNPSTMANLVQAAVEAAVTEPPEDLSDWIGVSMLVIDRDELNIVGGWRCQKCGFVFGGVDELPLECPGCKGS